MLSILSENATKIFGVKLTQKVNSKYFQAFYKILADIFRFSNIFLKNA